MRQKFILLFGLVIAFLSSAEGLNAQTNPCLAQDSFLIVILGSSTAAGSGSSTPDSAWVNRYRDFLQEINPGNEVINLAIPGYNTYRIMPSNFTPPPLRPLPDTLRNITAALALNPDAIIVNMPSNDVASGFSYAEQMSNYDSIISQASIASVPVWICTTQPRSNFSIPDRQLQSDIKDSIIALYSPFAIDFWTTIALMDHTIDPFYDSGDGVHLNDLGHGLLSQRVIDINILDQIYVPSSITDVAALSVDISGDLICGDSNMLFQFTTTNLGVNDSSNVIMTFELTHIPSGAVTASTLTSFFGIETCTIDTANFIGNTFEPGNYSLTCVVSSLNDTLLANDSTTFEFSTTGHPSIATVNDTLCAPGNAELSAFFAIGDTVVWYDDLINPVPIGYGSPFFTPAISSTTTFYAEVVRGELFYSDNLATTNTSTINWNGTMFDVIAQTELVIDSFEVKINTLGTQEVEIYTKLGSHIGFEQDPVSWTLLGSVFVDVSDPTLLTTVPLGNASIAINDTLGVYIQLANPASSLSYVNTGTTQSYSNSELTISSGSGMSNNFGVNFFPRLWNGSVFYHHGTRLQGDCSTERQPVLVEMSDVTFTLGQDTIIDILDTLLLTAPIGMIDYDWYNGDQLQVHQIIASDLGYGIHYITVDITDSLLCTYSDTIVIAIADLVKLHELDNNLIVYPNPTKGILYFEEASFKSVDLLSLTGTYIRSIPLEDNTINITDLPNGLYFITIPGQNSRRIRIIKQ